MKVSHISPFEGFKTFETKEHVEPSKTWRVTFSKLVDQRVTSGAGKQLSKSAAIGFSVK